MDASNAIVACQNSATQIMQAVYDFRRNYQCLQAQGAVTQADIDAIFQNNKYTLTELADGLSALNDVCDYVTVDDPARFHDITRILR